MTLPAIGVADGVVLATYVIALLVPGGLLGLAGGLRGWSLVAAAPLFTYAMTGVAGPLYSALGIRWSVPSWGVGVAVVVLVAFGIRLLARRRGGTRPELPALPRWSTLAQAGVAVCALGAVATGIVVILGGIGDLSAIPQDWDAVFHANGIRLIADTGDGGLYAMGRVNWYEDGLLVFYPNAYHLLATVVYEVTGASIPVVLNAHTVLIPGILAVSLIAMVRRFGGRPLLAGSTALAVVSVTSIYDLLWRGPLLPFATGVALTPVLVVLVRDALDAPTLRSALRPLALFVIGMAGLLCLHPAILIGAILFTVPALVQRWWQQPGRALPEILRLAAAGVVAAVVCAPELAGTLSSAGNLSAISWPADLTLPESVGQLLTFGHSADTAELRLALILVLGLLAYRRLGDLRWVGGTAAIFGVLFVIAASNGQPWAKAITSLWWNDRWRLVALAAVPMCVIIGHGVAEAQRWLAGALAATIRMIRRRPPETDRADRPAGLIVALATSLVVLLAFTLLTRAFYIGRDQQRMTYNTGNGPAVSHLEITGMEAIGQIVPPGERVLNDRGDGSAWLYALTGVKPVGGHYDPFRIGPEAVLLSQRFNQYPDDPAVRAAVAALDIQYVQLDAGFLRSDASRAAGLTGLAQANWLTLVYRNPDVLLYKINGTAPGATGTPAEPHEQTSTAGTLLSDGSG